MEASVPKKTCVPTIVWQLRFMNASPERRPTLKPSFPLAYRQTSSVVTNVESPRPHLGWYSRGYLPHWDHPGMIQSVNFHLADALPVKVIKKWKAELDIITRTGRPDACVPTQCAVELGRRIEEYLDAGRGECWLNRTIVARVVEEALFYFDQQRYRLLAWCVMPNHVHVLFEIRRGFSLPSIVHSWKSYTANEANKLLNRRGEFWQREYFDRYIRNVEHYEAIVAYIEENPVIARLARVKTDWPWSSARFRIRPKDL